MAYTIRPYKESDRVTQLRQSLAQAQSARPEYTSRFDTQLDEAREKLSSRGPFTYDPESDPMYHSYRDLYVQGGKLAMEDTMGKAAALTGGYASSYGQQVGQQTYNAWLQNLGEKTEELYSLALDTYTREGEALKDNYKLLSEQENQDYSRYLDSLNTWLGERQYQTDLLNTERSFDYSQSRDTEADRKWLATHPELAQTPIVSLGANLPTFSGSSGKQKEAAVSKLTEQAGSAEKKSKTLPKKRTTRSSGGSAAGVSGKAATMIALQ